MNSIISKFLVLVGFSTFLLFSQPVHSQTALDLQTYQAPKTYYTQGFEWIARDFCARGEKAGPFDVTKIFLDDNRGFFPIRYIGSSSRTPLDLQSDPWAAQPLKGMRYGIVVEEILGPFQGDNEISWVKGSGFINDGFGYDILMLEDESIVTLHNSEELPYVNLGKVCRNFDGKRGEQMSAKLSFHNFENAESDNFYFAMLQDGNLKDEAILFLVHIASPSQAIAYIPYGDIIQVSTMEEIESAFLKLLSISEDATDMTASFVPFRIAMTYTSQDPSNGEKAKWSSMYQDQSTKKLFSGQETFQDKVRKERAASQPLSYTDLITGLLALSAAGHFADLSKDTSNQNVCTQAQNRLKECEFDDLGQSYLLCGHIRKGQYDSCGVNYWADQNTGKCYTSYQRGVNAICGK